MNAFVRHHSGILSTTALGALGAGAVLVDHKLDGVKGAVRVVAAASVIAGAAYWGDHLDSKRKQWPGGNSLETGQLVFAGAAAVACGLGAAASAADTVLRARTLSIGLGGAALGGAALLGLTTTILPPYDRQNPLPW
jgi:hypothetical protein